MNAGGPSAEDVTAALRGRWHGSYGSARCPAHDDRSPSLSISQGRDVPLVMKCHANCSFENIVAACESRGIRMRNDRPFSPPVLPARSTNGKHTDDDDLEWPTVTPLHRENEIYDYCDESGAVLCQKVRKPDKTFYWQRPDGPGSIDGIRRVLYRLPELQASPDALVWLCEGEKDADRLASLGWVATTAPSSSAWDQEFSRELMGRTVIALQDNDETGQKYVAMACSALRGVAANVAPLLLPGLLPKGDVSDWLDAGGTVEELERLATLALTVEDYPLQTLAELMSTTDIDEPELIAGLLWRGRTHWLFSAPNTGKTLLVIAEGLHIAAGRPFHGRQVQRGTVVMIEEDSPLSIVAEYVDMLADIYEIDLEGLPFYITKEPGLRITSEDARQRLINISERFSPAPALIIFDSCERIVPSDKFTTKELDPFTTGLQILSNRGITLVVIDHTRKLPTPSQSAKASQAPKVEIDPIDLLYGGRAKSAAADVMMFMTGKVSKDSRLNFVKFRGEEPPAMTIGFRPDEGFILTSSSRAQTKTPTEQEILAWFQNGHSQQWYESHEIFAGAGVKERTGERALTTLVKRQWITKEGTTKGAKFRFNTSLPGLTR
jgi:hypothetical protein